MNIFSFLVMLYSFELGVIPIEASSPLYENQSEMSYYADFGVTFVLFDKLSISGNIENNFVYYPDKEFGNYAQFSPFLDIYTAKINYKINNNISIFVTHFCKHIIESNHSLDVDILVNDQTKTKIGFKISNNKP